MKQVRQYNRFQAAEEIHQVLRQWRANAGELARHCQQTPHAREFLETLYETLLCADEWYDLEGTMKITVMFTPALPGTPPEGVEDIPF